MSRMQIIAEIKSYAALGTLQTGSPEAIRRRINTLSDIEYAAQEARELLEAALDAAEERASTAHKQQEAAGHE